MSIVRCESCDRDIDTDYNTEIYPTKQGGDICFACIDEYNELLENIVDKYREEIRRDLM